MIKTFYVVLLILLPAATMGTPTDSLITKIDASKSIWIDLDFMRFRYFLESTNSGADWDTVRFDVEGDPRHIHFSLDFNSPSPIIAKSDSHWVLPGFDGTFNYTGALMISENAGATWKYVTLPNEIKTISEQDIHFSDAQNGVILSLQNIWNTSDGGYTWTKNRDMKVPKKEFGTFSMFFYDSLVGTIKAHYGYWHTVDGGQSWSQQIGNNQVPTDNESLKHALLQMNWSAIRDHQTSFYIYTDSSPVKHFEISFEQLTSNITITRDFKEKSVYYVNSEPTSITVLDKKSKPIAEMINVDLKPGKIYVLKMSVTPNTLIEDTDASARINAMCQEILNSRLIDIVRYY